MERSKDKRIYITFLPESSVFTVYVLRPYPENYLVSSLYDEDAANSMASPLDNMRFSGVTWSTLLAYAMKMVMNRGAGQLNDLNDLNDVVLYFDADDYLLGVEELGEKPFKFLKIRRTTVADSPDSSVEITQIIFQQHNVSGNELPFEIILEFTQGQNNEPELQAVMLMQGVQLIDGWQTVAASRNRDKVTDIFYKPKDSNPPSGGKDGSASGGGGAQKKSGKNYSAFTGGACGSGGSFACSLDAFDHPESVIFGLIMIWAGRNFITESACTKTGFSEF